MSAPNEYLPSASHEFHQDGVASIITQCTLPNSNFVSFTPTGTNDGGAYFNNGEFFANSIGYEMSPVFNPNSEIPIQFEAQQQTNMYDAENTQNAVYWSRQSHPGLFGVLPHETTAVQSNLQINFDVPQSPLDVGNSTLMNSSGETSDFLYGSKDVELDSPIVFDQQSMSYGDQNSLKNDQNFKEHFIDSQRVSTEPSPDFIPYKSELAFTSNSQTPVVKYTSKPAAKQLVINNENLHLVNDRLEPKLPDLHNSSRLSPINPTTNHIDQRGQTDTSFLSHNRANDIISHHVSSPLMYHDVPDVSDSSSSVASPYSMELPYSTPVVNSTNTNATEISHLNQSLYSMYDSVTNSAISPVQSKHLSEENINLQSQPQIMNNSCSSEVLPKATIANDYIGFSSVIMQTDENFENQEVSSIRSPWASNSNVTVGSEEVNALPHFQASGHRPIFMYPDGRSPSYLRSLPCPVSPQSINRVVNDIASAIESGAKPPKIFSDQRQDQPIMRSYQYCLPNEEKTYIPTDQHSIVGAKIPRKRKTSKKKSIARSKKSEDPSSIGLNEKPESQNQSVPQNSSFVSTKCGTPERGNVFPPLSAPQFYAPNSIVTHPSNSSENLSHESLRHLSVISSISSASSVSSSPVNSQLSQPHIPEQPMISSPSVQLPSYLSSCELSPCPNGSETHPSVDRDTTSTAITKSERTTIKRRVIVPDIEEEFSFLFYPTLPNYDIISRDDAKDLYQTTGGTKSTFYSKNADFLASYMKFLENNCESVETLNDGNSSTTKNWPRNKQFHQPTMKDTENVKSEPVSSSSEEVKSTFDEVECDFQNDPRYYPLPKTSDERRLTDSSSDEETESHTSKIVAQTKKREKSRRPKTKEIKKSRSKSATEAEGEMCVQIKSTNSDTDRINSERGKHKSKLDEELKIKSRDRQNIKMNELKSRRINRYWKEEPIDRKIPNRKTKLDVSDEIKKTISSDEAESSDSDPPWKPQDGEAEEEFNVSTRRSTRLRAPRFPQETNSNAKKNEDESYQDMLQRMLENVENHVDEVMDSFYVQRDRSGSKMRALWRKQNDRLQKFEETRVDGKQVFSSILEYVKASDKRLSKCEKVDVRVVHQSDSCLTVELCDEMYIPTDSKIRDNFMKESLHYQKQFAAYIQTLLSQALDSNFSSEIVREKDAHFLDNVKAIEDVTATYLNNLTTIMIWGPSHIEMLVKTWPFVSMESSSIDFRGDDDDKKCLCCCEVNAVKTAVFYGQPYNQDTLQGSTSNIPNNIDKTVKLCRGCGKRIQLFNKIWHQKYHLFVECAKRVSKKKSEARNNVTSTTDILNEILSDHIWLYKLFNEVRNTWLLIWTVVQKPKNK